MKRSSIKHRKTKRSQQAQREYDAFRDRWHGHRCMTCTLRYGCHRHHIVYRDGDDWDDQRNLLWVCDLCHQRLHGTTVAWRGIRLPGWDKSIAFQIACEAKQKWDREYWDAGYIDYLNYWERHYRETGRMEYQE